jgi:anti-sigma factor RsiW
MTETDTHIPALTCKELVELVTDYLEGSLPARDRLRFEDHLAVCDPCRVYVEQMRETVRLAGQVRERDIPPHARESLLATFRAWRQAS